MFDFRKKRSPLKKININIVGIFIKFNYMDNTKKNNYNYDNIMFADTDQMRARWEPSAGLQ